MLNPNEPDSQPSVERRLVRMTSDPRYDREVVSLAGNDSPWERLPGEPLRWFLAFERYLRLPAHSRTIRNAVLQENEVAYQNAYSQWQMESVKAKAAGQPVPPEPPRPRAKSIKSSNYRSWERYSTIYQWPARAQAHDALLYQQEMREYDELRRTSKQRRRRTLMDLLDVGAKALQPYLNAPEPPKINLKDLVMLVTKTTQELRAEFNDEPTTKIESTDGVAMTLDRILASARAKMREDGEAFEEETEPPDEPAIEGEWRDTDSEAAESTD